MEFMLGAAVRAGYSQFLLPYQPQNIYVRSTDVDRTINSATNFLFGLFSGTGPQLANSATTANASYIITTAVGQSVQQQTGSYALPNAFMPVPVHVVQAINDTFLQSYAGSCATSDLYSNLNYNNTLVTNAWTYFQPLVTQLNTRLKAAKLANVTSVDDLYYLADTVLSDYYSGTAVPLGLNPNDPLWKNLTFCYGYFSDCISFATYKYTQLWSVPMFIQLVQYLNNSISGASPLKGVFLSAHDGTLGLMLAALNLTTPTCMWNNFFNSGIVNDTACHYPIFSSNIKFELSQNGTGNYVQLYYDDQLLTIPGCPSPLCPYSTFLSVVNKATGNHTMTDFNNFCAN